MALERHAERGGRGLPRVVVGRRADAAEAEHEVAARERVAQQRRQAVAVVADVMRVVEREPARGERLDHVRQVAVLPLAGQDLVADDQRADRHGVRIDARAATRAAIARERRPDRHARRRFGNFSSICDIMLVNARSISGSASTRRARSARKRSARSSAVIDSAFWPCRLVNR